MRQTLKFTIPLIFLLLTGACSESIDVMAYGIASNVDSDIVGEMRVAINGGVDIYPINNGSVLIEYKVKEGQTIKVVTRCLNTCDKKGLLRANIRATEGTTMYANESIQLPSTSDRAVAEWTYIP